MIESEGGGSENSTTTCENGEKSRGEDTVTFIKNGDRFRGEDTVTIVKDVERSGSRENVNFLRADTGACGTVPAERVVVERKFQLQFAVEPTFMDTLKRVTSLLSTMYPQGITFEMVFTILMQDYLDRHDPERRAKRRDERRNRSAGSGGESEIKKNGATVESNGTEKLQTAGRARLGRTATMACGATQRGISRSIM